jgi:hypothetical protein
MGWLTTEQLVWNDKGQLSTHAPSTYKIPTTGDIPVHFKVALWPEPNREDNIFGSKAVGEPPFMLAISVFEAMKDAVANARANGGAVQVELAAEFSWVGRVVLGPCVHDWRCSCPLTVIVSGAWKGMVRWIALAYLWALA